MDAPILSYKLIMLVFFFLSILGHNLKGWKVVIFDFGGRGRGEVSTHESLDTKQNSNPAPPDTSHHGFGFQWAELEP